MQLNSVRLLVDRFDACFRFYRDVLGLEPVWGEEGGRYADFKAGDGTLIALFRRALMAEAVGTEDRPSDAPAQDRAALVASGWADRESVLVQHRDLAGLPMAGRITGENAPRFRPPGSELVNQPER